MNSCSGRRRRSAIDALRAQIALRVTVHRDGVDSNVPVTQVVPGDIVRLAAGDVVPADGVLLESRDFFINQALLTGEAYPVEKHVAEHGEAAAEINSAANSALAGTSVVSGIATLLVCRTGSQTTLGGLASTLIAAPPPTAFEIGLCDPPLDSRGSNGGHTQ